MARTEKNNPYRKSPEQRSRDRVRIEQYKWPPLPRVRWRIYVKSFVTGQYILYRYQGTPLVFFSRQAAEMAIEKYNLYPPHCRVRPYRERKHDERR